MMDKIAVKCKHKIMHLQFSLELLYTIKISKHIIWVTELDNSGCQVGVCLEEFSESGGWRRGVADLMAAFANDDQRWLYCFESMKSNYFYICTSFYFAIYVRNKNSKQLQRSMARPSYISVKSEDRRGGE